MSEWKNNRLVKHVIMLAIYLSIIILLCILNVIYKKAFYESTISSIQQIQEDGSRAKQLFFKGLYYLGDQRTYIILIMLLFNFQSRQDSFYYASVICLSLTVSQFLKMTFQDGRPFMFSPQIYPYICELTFANPSLEIQNAVAFFLVTGLYFYEKFKQGVYERTSKNMLVVTFIVLGAIVMTILIAVQGLFNGDNFIDQILFGFQIGIVIAIFSHFYMKPLLQQHVTDVLDGIYIQKYKKLQTYSTLAFIFMLLVMTILYFINLLTFETPKLWMSQIQIKCPISKELSQLIFEDADYVQIGLLFFLLGAYYGLLIDARYFNGTHKDINKTSLKNSLIRLCLSLLFILPCFVFPVIFISDSNSVLTIFFVKYGLPSFLTSIVLFGVSRKAYERFNLVQDEIFKENTTYGSNKIQSSPEIGRQLINSSDELNTSIF